MFVKRIFNFYLVSDPAVGFRLFMLRGNIAKFYSSKYIKVYIFSFFPVVIPTFSLISLHFCITFHSFGFSCHFCRILFRLQLQSFSNRLCLQFRVTAFSKQSSLDFGERDFGTFKNQLLQSAYCDIGTSNCLLDKCQSTQSRFSCDFLDLYLLLFCLN